MHESFECFGLISGFRDYCVKYVKVDSNKLLGRDVLPKLRSDHDERAFEFGAFSLRLSYPKM